VHKIAVTIRVFLFSSTNVLLCSYVIYIYVCVCVRIHVKHRSDKTSTLRVYGLSRGLCHWMCRAGSTRQLTYTRARELIEKCISQRKTDKIVKAARMHNDDDKITFARTPRVYVLLRRVYRWEWSERPAGKYDFEKKIKKYRLRMIQNHTFLECALHTRKSPWRIIQTRSNSKQYLCISRRNGLEFVVMRGSRSPHERRRLGEIYIIFMLYITRADRVMLPLITIIIRTHVRKLIAQSSQCNSMLL